MGFLIGLYRPSLGLTHKHTSMACDLGDLEAGLDASLAERREHGSSRWWCAWSEIKDVLDCLAVCQYPIWYSSSLSVLDSTDMTSSFLFTLLTEISSWLELEKTTHTIVTIMC